MWNFPPLRIVLRPLTECLCPCDAALRKLGLLTGIGPEPDCTYKETLSRDSNFNPALETHSQVVSLSLALACNSFSLSLSLLGSLSLALSHGLWHN